MKHSFIPAGPSARLRPLTWLMHALLAGVLLSGCGGGATPTPPAQSQATPSVAASPTPAATVTVTPVAGPLTLTWWTPEFLSPQAPQGTGALLAEQLEAFSAAQGDLVRVDAVVKARYGKGGLLDFLLTSQTVAPGVLPDLVLLDVVELEKAVDAGALQSLDLLVDPGVTDALYPFAREAGQFGERLDAVQYLADVGHLAYLAAQVPQPPASTDEILQGGTAYLFPVARPQAGTSARPVEGLSRAVLSQYLSAGGMLDEERDLTLDKAPLEQLLAFYERSAKAGLLPPNAIEMADGEETWSVFAQGQAPLAYVSARRFATERATLQPGFGPAPALSVPAVPIAGGWALAIVTPDPQRQQAAAELIAWLLDPERSAAITRAAGWLPVMPQALVGQAEDPYFAFLDSQLAAARSVPVGPDYEAAAARIQTAVLAVVKGELTAAAAATAALAAP